jgi:hypothetical protein
MKNTHDSIRNLTGTFRLVAQFLNQMHHHVDVTTRVAAWAIPLVAGTTAKRVIMSRASSGHLKQTIRVPIKHAHKIFSAVFQFLSTTSWEDNNELCD